MDKETFTNSVISDILNNKYYPVKFDAEGKESVTFFGQTFINDGNQGRHISWQLLFLMDNCHILLLYFLFPRKMENLQPSLFPVTGNQKTWRYC